MSIFESFMRGRQLAQQENLQRMQIARMQSLEPLQRQLQELELEQAKQQIAAGQQSARANELKIEEAEALKKSGYISPYEKEKLKLDKLLTLSKISQDSENEKPSLKDIKSINDSVTKLTEEAEGIADSASSLEKLSKNATPAAKLAGVIKFMKALDPRSIVTDREGNQVFNLDAVPERMKGYIRQLQGEGALSETVFNDLVDTAKLLANDRIEGTESSVSNYLSVFTELQPDRVQLMKKRIPSRFDVTEKKDPSQMTDDELMQELNRIQGNR